MTGKLVHSVGRVVGRFLRAPFENLPREYGDVVPPDLRRFEAETGASEREREEDAAVPQAHDQRSRPARHDESLERERF
jgi:hypothetical protein